MPVEITVIISNKGRNSLWLHIFNIEQGIFKHFLFSGMNSTGVQLHLDTLERHQVQLVGFG